MWIYVVLSIVILIAIFYLFKKDKDTLSDPDPTVSLQRVEINIERKEEDDDNVENYNYTLDKDVEMGITLAWTNGVGWSDKFNFVHIYLYFGGTVVADKLISRVDMGDVVGEPQYFKKFSNHSMTFSTKSKSDSTLDSVSKSTREIILFKEGINLTQIIDQKLYFRMTVDDGSGSIELFKDPGGKRELIDPSSSNPIMITEEQIQRVVEVTGLTTLEFPLNISEFSASSIEFGPTNYLKIKVTDSKNLFLKPTGTPGRFIYYKEPYSGLKFDLPGELKLYAPILKQDSNYAVISYTSLEGKKYFMYDNKFIPEDDFKSSTFKSGDRFDYSVEIEKHANMGTILNQANYDYANELLPSTSSGTAPGRWPGLE